MSSTKIRRLERGATQLNGAARAGQRPLRAYPGDREPWVAATLRDAALAGTDAGSEIVAATPRRQMLITRSRRRALAVIQTKYTQAASHFCRTHPLFG